MELDWEETEEISRLHAIDPKLADEYMKGIEQYMIQKKLYELERKAYEDKMNMYAPVTCPPQTNSKPFGPGIAGPASTIYTGVKEEPKKENEETRIMRVRALLMEEINNVKYCSNCRYSKRLGWWNFDTRLRCNHPLIVDLVSGKPNVLCSDERRSSGTAMDPRKCGIDGRLYEEDV
jgi:hypothetical protein